MNKGLALLILGSTLLIMGIGIVAELGTSIELEETGTPLYTTATTESSMVMEFIGVIMGFIGLLLQIFGFLIQREIKKISEQAHEPEEQNVRGPQVSVTKDSQNDFVSFDEEKIDLESYEENPDEEGYLEW